MDALQVDLDLERCRRLAVRSTPTLIGFRGGVEVARLVGEQDGAAIDSLFAALLDGPAAGSPARRPRSRPPSRLLLLRLAVAAVLVAAGSMLDSVALVIVAAAIALWAGAPYLRQARRRP